MSDLIQADLFDSDVAPADLLDKAAEHIEINGWWQGAFVKRIRSAAEECPACLLGAINIVAGVESGADLYGDREAAARALAEHLDPGETYNFDEVDLADWIASWNDANDRTAEQVVTELRACAADLRQGAT